MLLFYRIVGLYWHLGVHLESGCGGPALLGGAEICDQLLGGIGGTELAAGHTIRQGLTNKDARLSLVEQLKRKSNLLSYNFSFPLIM